MHKILFIDDAHPVLQKNLEDAGFMIDTLPLISRSKILDILNDYTGVIIRSRILFDKEIFDAAKNLRFVGRIGAGMESIDINYAASKNIICFNSPEGNRDAVGEHTIMLLLALLNKLIIADAQIRRGVRERESNRGIEIKGKTVAIIGYGNMGSAFAQRLSGFDAKVIAYDKYKTGYSDSFVKEVQMPEIFEKADIISLHVPLTLETKFLINQDFLSNFKKPIWLINTARGPVVKTSDLVTALKSGIIQGAALDVIEYENISFETIDTANLPDDYLYLIQSDKVVLTPHVAGWTYESKIKLAKVLAEKIIAWAGENKLL